jgi:arylsulfatase
MTSRPNVLLVTIDSLRADHVYGEAASTPAHDSLAEDGTVYERAFAQGPFTTFSMPSLFTSRYPSGLQYMEFSKKTVGVYIEDEPTIPTVLRDVGYDTAGFHSNPLLSNLFGFDRGFDTFDAKLPFTDTGFVPGRAKILADKLLRLVRKHAYLPADRLTDRALRWLDEREGNRPFFLWVHYMDVHGPYQAKKGSTYLNKYRGERLWRKCLEGPEAITPDEHKHLRELYQMEVEYTDKQVGRLLKGLRDRGAYDDTITVATADHGEQFGEYGEYSHPHQLYDVLTRVPLIVRTPGKQLERVTGIRELLDVAPTLSAEAGASAPESFRGTRLPLIDESNEAEEQRTAISEADILPAYHGSIRTPEWRYVRNDITGTEFLFDTTDPPGDRTNWAADHQSVVKRLSRRLNEHVMVAGRDAGTDVERTAEEIDDSDVEDRLKTLGYLE